MTGRGRPWSNNERPWQNSNERQEIIRSMSTGLHRLWTDFTLRLRLISPSTSIRTAEKMVIINRFVWEIEWGLKHMRGKFWGGFIMLGCLHFNPFQVPDYLVLTDYLFLKIIPSYKYLKKSYSSPKLNSSRFIVFIHGLLWSLSLWSFIL